MHFMKRNAPRTTAPPVESLDAINIQGGASTAIESFTCCYPTFGKYQESPYISASRSASTDSSTSCGRRVLPHILSIPCFSVILIIFSIIVTAICILVISETFGRSAAKELAITTTRALASSYESRIGNFLSQPLKDITRWQYQMAVGSRKLPSEESNNGQSWDWTTDYLNGCSGILKGSDFNYTFVSFGFADGGYAACRERNNSYFDVLGVQWHPLNTSVTTAPATVPPAGNMPFIPNPPTYGKTGLQGTISHDGRYTDMELWVATTYDPRTRPWYVGAPHGQPMARRWGEVSLTVGEVVVPSIGLSAPIYNVSGYQLGAMTVTYRLEMMHSLLSQLPQLYASTMVLLDNNLKIVGSSLERDDGDFMIREVPANYTITPDETRLACIKGSRSRISRDGLTVVDLLCQHTIESFNYGPLVDLQKTNFALLSTGTENLTEASGFVTARDLVVHKQTLGKDNYYLSVISVDPMGAQNMHWRIVLFIPEEEVTKVIDESRKVIIGVTAALIVSCAIIFSGILWLVLRPLSRVVALMQTAAYLSSPEAGSSNASLSSSGVRNPTELAKAEKARQTLISDRRLSVWKDLRAIQIAYWAMADEVNAMKGYIPEHVREEIIQNKLAAIVATHQKEVKEAHAKGETTNPTSTAMRNASPGGNLTASALHSKQAVNPRIFSPRDEMTEIPVPLDASGRKGNPDDGINLSRNRLHPSAGNTTDDTPSPNFNNNHLNPIANTNSGLIGGNTGEDAFGGGPRRSLVEDGLGSQLNGSSTFGSPSQRMDALARNELNGSLNDHSITYNTATHNGKAISNHNTTNTNNNKVSTTQNPPISKLSSGEASVVAFRDNVLIDRDITVVAINIIQFHAYARVTHGEHITADHATLISFIHNQARKCGGVLENFSGDKFWISFNATTKCDRGPVAACCFAYEVTKTVNDDAIEGIQRRAINVDRKINNKQPLAPDEGPRHKFRSAPFGISCGIATGRAYVGPLGTDQIKRHTIISNAMTEAAALERQSLRYPGCAVMIGGDMIPCVEGYVQYLLVDASLLPGSGGKRRRIASVRYPMCREGNDKSYLRGLSNLGAALNRKVSPYETLNESFNAFLEGRDDQCQQLLASVDRRLEQLSDKNSNNINNTALLPPQNTELPTPFHPSHVASQNRLPHVVEPPPPPQRTANDPDDEQIIEMRVMSQLLWSFLRPGAKVDGRIYRSLLGESHMPFAHILRLAQLESPENAPPVLQPTI